MQLTLQLEKYHYLLITTGSIIAGLVIYSVLSYLLIPQRIIIPISIIMSMLIFGLIEYYSRLHIDSNYIEDLNTSLRNDQKNDVLNTDRREIDLYLLFSLLPYLLP